MRLPVAVTLLVLAGLCCGHDQPKASKTGDIVFPTPPPPIPQPPRPTPPTPTTQPIKLLKNERYVMYSDAAFFVQANGVGQVEISNKEPGWFHGMFVYGEGKDEDRQYKAPYIVSVKPISSGPCDLIVTPSVVTSNADIKIQSLMVEMGTGPIPPPIDPPIPTPIPPNPANPLPATKLMCQMIYESADTLTSKQRGILSSETVHKAIKDAGGEWRCWDRNVDYSKEAAWWKSAMDYGKNKTMPLVLISSPKGFYEGFPADVNAFIAEINKLK